MTIEVARPLKSVEIVMKKPQRIRAKTKFQGSLVGPMASAGQIGACLKVSFCDLSTKVEKLLEPEIVGTTSGVTDGIGQSD